MAKKEGGQLQRLIAQKTFILAHKFQEMKFDAEIYTRF